MIKESRLVVRLISLWIIFIASLVLLFWAGQNLAVSAVKTVYGGYENYQQNAYGNYCLQYPAMPPQDMMGQPETKAQNEKYTKELEKYNADFVAACKVDQAKQESAKAKQEESASIGNIAAFTLLTLGALIALAVSLKAIKKGESEA